MKLVRWFIKSCLNRGYILIRWLLLAGITGIALGILGGAFVMCIDAVTELRKAHPWMIYILPAAGLAIVALYRLDKYNAGTNRVLEGVQSGAYVPLRMAPLIIVSTVITHAFGGSAGREGAALQLGGSIGGTLGKLMKLDERDRRIMIMCGMSAAFSALFGTPLTAAIFSMEIVSVGIMHYAALVPCCIAAMTASEVVDIMGVHGDVFKLSGGLGIDAECILMMIIFAVLCAAVSIVFCKLLHGVGRYAEMRIGNPWIRAAAGGILVVLLSLLIGTTDYLGTGIDVIAAALEGDVFFAAFALKMLFTVITLCSGYKGGAIIPALFVGATFGCLFGQIPGLDAPLFAACGMIGVFCGITNCPVTSLLMAFELFGMEYMPCFLIVVSISYMESGYSGLYESQKLVYSKTELKYINRRAK